MQLQITTLSMTVICSCVTHLMLYVIYLLPHYIDNNDILYILIGLFNVFQYRTFDICQLISIGAIVEYY